jgi:carboxylesterase
MTTTPSLRPDPFFLPGGPNGALLIHGFTGSPPEMRLVGDYLNLRGFTVSAPLLPGHGTRPADLNTVRWQDWAEATEAALAQLAARCQGVCVAGLSLGALLALRLAAQHPEIAAVAAYSPALRASDWRVYFSPLMKRLMPLTRKRMSSDLRTKDAFARLWSYDWNPTGGVHEVLRLQTETRRILPGLRPPLLVIYSTADRTIHPTAPHDTYRLAGSATKELITLHASGHGITVDGEWETVAESTYRFFMSQLSGAAK